MTNASKLIKTVVVFAVYSALSGCATKWYSGNFATEDAKARQLKIDTGYCEGVSYGAMPLPSQRIYTPGQATYAVSGTTTGYDSSGNYSSFQYTGTAKPRISGAEQFAEGFASGYTAVAQIAATNARAKIYTSCMLRLGWSEKPVGQQETVRGNPSNDLVGYPPEDWFAIERSDAPTVYIDRRSIGSPKKYPQMRFFWFSSNLPTPLKSSNGQGMIRSVHFLAAIDCKGNKIAFFKNIMTSEEFGKGTVLARNEMNMEFLGFASNPWADQAEAHVCGKAYDTRVMDEETG